MRPQPSSTRGGCEPSSAPSTPAPRLRRAQERPRLGRGARGSGPARGAEQPVSPAPPSDRRLPLPEYLDGCTEDQGEIEGERPVADVGDIHLERLVEAGVRTCRHLPETGDARRGQEALVVVRGEIL